MEIEHINDDTIRVRIENADLEARGYTFLDLLGNQKHIESFFYSILEEVDLDNEFQESDAVTFQVMPNRNGLELFISKNADIHENFFSNTDFDSFEDSQFNQEYSHFEDSQKSNKEKTFPKSFEQQSENEHFVIEFIYFEQIVQLARVFQISNGFSSLYQFNGKYYIEFNLMQDEYAYRTFEEDLAIVLEYGENSPVSADVLSEHGKLLIENNALETVKYYFR